MKKLSLILILAAVILGVYGCSDDIDGISPVKSANSEKVEHVLKHCASISIIDYNKMEDTYYMIAFEYNSMKLILYTSKTGEDWTLLKDMSKDYKYFDLFRGGEDIQSLKMSQKGNLFIQYKNTFFSVMNDFEILNNLNYLAKYEYKGNIIVDFSDINIDDDGVIYSGCYLKSTDEGFNWTFIETPFENGDYFYKTYIYGNMIIADFKDCIWKSEDKGETWIKVLDKKTSESPTELYYYKLENIPTNKQVEYKITRPEEGIFNIIKMLDNGLIIANWEGYKENDYFPGYASNCNIHTSTDNGETWNYELSFMDTYTSSYSGSPAIYYTKSGYIYAKTGDGIVRNIKPIK